MNYAIVEDGGNQYKAVIGGTIEVDHFDSEVGEEIDLERVLLVTENDKIEIGTPFIRWRQGAGNRGSPGESS